MRHKAATPRIQVSDLNAPHASAKPMESTATIAEPPSDPHAFWKQLVDTANSQEPVLFGLRSTHAITIDGSRDPQEWTHCFETRLFDPTVREHAARPVARCTWDDEMLYIVVLGFESATKLGKPGYCQVVLSPRDPAEQCRFAIDTSGAKFSHRLSVNSCQELPVQDWHGAMRSTATDLSAEFAISRQCLELDAFEFAGPLTLTVRIGRGQVEAFDSPVTPAYWLFDSLHGAKAQVVFVDPAVSEGPSTGYRNGVVEPGRFVLQWDLERYDVATGVERSFAVDLFAFKPTDAVAGDPVPMKAHLVSPDGTVHSLNVPLGRTDASITSDLKRMRVVLPEQVAPGLYTLHLLLHDRADPRSVASWPLWFTSEWITPTRQYLLGCRDHLETLAGDPWSRSIALAHVDKTLNELESSREIDVTLLNTMTALGEAVETYQEGYVPPIPAGTSKLTLSDEHGATAGLTTHVPSHYDPRLAWPLCWGPRVLPNMISIQSSDSTAAWVVESATLRKGVHLDSGRVYAFAYCHQAYLTTDLLVRRPEPWAAICLNARIRWTPLAPNALHVPVLLYCHAKPTNTDRDTRGDVDLLVSHTGAQWMRQQGCNIQQKYLPYQSHHDMPDEQLPEVARWLLQHRRHETPAVVQCVAEGYEHSSKYWVSMDAIAAHRRFACLSASIEADSLVVKTNGNVLGYTLQLDHAPLPSHLRSVSVIEDGHAIATIDTGVQRKFTRVPDGFAEKDHPRKCVTNPGTIMNALTRGPFRIVFGTADGDPQRAHILSSLAARLASTEQIRVSGPPLPGRECDPQSMTSTDMIVIGSFHDHALLRNLYEHMPIEFGDDGVRIGDRRFSGNNVGFIGVYPHPFNFDRVIIIVAGESGRMLERMVRFLDTERPEVFDSDYVIFEYTGDSKPLEVLWADQFDWSWQPVHGSPPLVTLMRSHPDWQWTQLTAELVRQQAGADAFLAHRMIRVSLEKLSGPISAHDLYQHFYNDWIVVAHTTPSVLRKTLPPAISAFPEVLTIDLFHPESGAFQPAIRVSDSGSGTADTLLKLATLVSCEDFVERQIPADALRTRTMTLCPHLYATRCELTALRIADVLVEYCRGLEHDALDELLDRQQRPVSIDKIKLSVAMGADMEW